MARTPQDPQVRINEILDYFKSKEEVLKMLLDRHANSLISEINTILSITNSPAEKIALTVSALLRKAACKNGLLLDMLYDAQNMHLKAKLFRQLELALSPWLLRLVVEGIVNRNFVVAHPPTAVDYILVIVEFLSEALYRKTSEDILSFRLKMAQALMEKALGAPKNTIPLLKAMR